jgi:hypothetical protein
VKHWASAYLGENRVSDGTCRIAGYSFAPLSGESGILTLWQGVRAVFLSGTVESARSLCSVGGKTPGASKITKPGAWDPFSCVMVDS